MHRQSGDPCPALFFFFYLTKKESVINKGKNKNNLYLCIFCTPHRSDPSQPPSECHRRAYKLDPSHPMQKCASHISRQDRMGHAKLGISPDSQGRGTKQSPLQEGRRDSVVALNKYPAPARRTRSQNDRACIQLVVGSGLGRAIQTRVSVTIRDGRGYCKDQRRCRTE